MKKFFKCSLLYVTTIYFIVYLIIAESLTENNPLYAFIGFFILLVLLAVCKKVFKAQELEEYIPKWFR